MRRLATPDIPDDRLLKFSSASEAIDKFFSCIGRVCAQEGKDILVVNPQTIGSENVSGALTYGLLATLTVSDSLNIYKRVNKQSVTRNGFLRGLGYFVGGISLASTLDFTRPLRKKLEEYGFLSNSGISKDKQADILGFHHEDWRDIQTARGIEKVAQVFDAEVSDGRSVPVMQGSGHNGIYEYLHDSDGREAKTKLYAPYNFVGRHSIRRYSFDRSKNKWELKVEIPY